MKGRLLSLWLIAGISLGMAIAACESENTTTSKPSFTVSFESNGGSSVPAMQVVQGEKVTKPANPTRVGFAFVAWYTESSLTTPFDFSTEVITANTTLYAKWTSLPVYKVAFVVNGGSKVDTQQVVQGEKVTKPANPTRVGFAFVAWYTESSLTTPFDFSTEVISANITLYAKWESLPVYGVTFVANGGSNVATQQVAQREKVTKPADPTRTGFTFVAWYKESSLTTPFDFSTEVITQDITLYAKWASLPVYKVAFVVNGGSTVDTQQVVQGGKVTKPADPTRAEFTFVAWYKESTLTTPFDFGTEVISANITLYAKWTPVTHTITFKRGSLSDSTLTVNHGGKIVEPTAIPYQAGGYSFGGWYKDNAATNVFDFSEAITEDITVHARWLDYEVTMSGDTITNIKPRNATITAIEIYLPRSME